MMLLSAAIFCSFFGCYDPGCYQGESTILGVRLVFIGDECMNIAAGGYDSVKDEIVIRSRMSEYPESEWLRVLWHEYGHHVGWTQHHDLSEGYANDYAASQWRNPILP